LTPHPDSPSWIKNKAIGEAAELRCAVWWREKGWDALKVLGEASAFDVEIRATVEVKADQQVHKTGNVAIEVSNGDRPSGLTTSKACFWWFDLGKCCVWIATTDLRELVAAGEFRQIVGGDGNKSVCKLVPAAVLREAPGARVIRLNDE